jgi:hypothetical protein
MLACTKSKFDIFARKTLQTAILANFTTLYKSIAPVEQTVLEFAIPGDNEHCVDLNDRLCGLMVRVLGYRCGGPGSIPGTTRKKSNWSGTGSTQPRDYN